MKPARNSHQGDDDGPGSSEGPVCRDALVFAIGDPGAVRPTVERFARGEAATSALGVALEYVSRHRDQGAELTPLYPERALEVLQEPSPGIPEALRWRVAVPDLRPPRQDLSAFHYLRLATPERSKFVRSTFLENIRLEATLKSDHLAITSVFHPAAPYNLPVAPSSSLVPVDPDWGIETCNFPQVWKCLDRGFDPGPIGVIDEGCYVRHPELDGRVTEFPPGSGTPSDVLHASQVAAVIAARRDDGTGMSGCCSAHVHLYNVSTDQGFDCKSFYFALKAVARDRLPVVNISMFMPPDPLVKRQIEECVCQGMFLVAAMGISGKEEAVYPAAYKDVIAVGATNVVEDRLNSSNSGKHIWLSAPGEYIHTLINRTDLGTKGNDGTSFATPMVSAAVWLALRANPGLDLTGMKALLAKSVFKKGLSFKDVGHGRLDMHKMVNTLHSMGVPGMGGCL